MLLRYTSCYCATAFGQTRLNADVCASPQVSLGFEDLPVSYTTAELQELLRPKSAILQVHVSLTRGTWVSVTPAAVQV